MMLNDVRKDEGSPESLGLLRRLFLKRALLATATTSAAAFLPTPGSGATREDSGLSTNCPDTKAPMKDVAGKVAFITGGSSGIGLGIARVFIDAGMKVVITYRTESHLKEAMDDLKGAGDCIHAIKVDVTDRPGLEAAAKETVARFGKVHVLVNNAGVYAPATLSAANDKDWDWMMNVNVKGVLNGVQVFLPLIQSHGEGGQIMATSSILGLFVYAPNEAGYAASKFAVVGMMESLRMELSGTNIGVSVLCPGWTEGKSGRSWMPKSEKDEAEFVRKEQAAIGSGMRMDGRAYGERVLRGMRNNDLYILTHSEWKPMMRYRSEALLAAIPRDSRPAPELLSASSKMTQNSIYVAEGYRKRC